MTYKITVARAPFTVEFECGSIGEAVAALTQDKSKLQELFELSDSINDDQPGEPAPAGGTAPQSQTSDSAPPTRKPRTPKNAAATASAPAPAPIPSAPAAGDGLDIPPELRRTAPAPATAAAPPPPPIMPPAAAPPVAPPAPTPPTSVHAAKIVAELQRRATGAADKGQALADWLASSGVITKGSNFDEAISVIPFTSDEKLTPLLQPLGLS